MFLVQDSRVSAFLFPQLSTFPSVWHCVRSMPPPGLLEFCYLVSGSYHASVSPSCSCLSAFLGPTSTNWDRNDTKLKDKSYTLPDREHVHIPVPKHDVYWHQLQLTSNHSQSHLKESSLTRKPKCSWCWVISCFCGPKRQSMTHLIRGDTVTPSHWFHAQTRRQYRPINSWCKF